MRKPTFIILGAAVAAMSFAPAAYARHKHKPVVMMSPGMQTMAPDGDFYATPMSKGPPMLGPELGAVPGLDIAGGVVNGVTQPILPGLDAAGGIVNGITAPLLLPTS